jgi:hypothetical protein
VELLRAGILAVGLALTGTVSLFPPLRIEDGTQQRGFLFSDELYMGRYEEHEMRVRRPDKIQAKEVYYIKANIDMPRLVGQWVLVASGTALLYLLAGLRRSARRAR